MVGHLSCAYGYASHLEAHLLLACKPHLSWNLIHNGLFVRQLGFCSDNCEELAGLASRKGAVLMIDAEQTYFQPTIDMLIRRLQRTHNKDRAVVSHRRVARAPNGIMFFIKIMNFIAACVDVILVSRQGLHLFQSNYLFLFNKIMDCITACVDVVLISRQGIQHVPVLPHGLFQPCRHVTCNL